jgi:hypothetical protein
MSSEQAHVADNSLLIAHRFFMKRLATFALLLAFAALPASANNAKDKYPKQQKQHNKYQGLTKGDRKAQAKEEKQMAKYAKKQQKAQRKMNKAVNKAGNSKHNLYKPTKPKHS